MDKVFQYRATLPKIKTFLRVYDIKADTTLFKLHSFLQNDLGFSPDQMALFRGVDEDGVVLSNYGLFDLGDGTMDTVTISDCIDRGQVMLHYIYNVKMGLYIILNFVQESEFSQRKSYPRLLQEKGRNPDQFSAEYDDYEALQEEMGITSEEEFEEEDGFQITED